MPRWIPLGIAALLLGVAAVAWSQDRDGPAPADAPPARVAVLAAPAATARQDRDRLAPDASESAVPWNAADDEPVARAPRARQPDARTAEEKRFARYDKNEDRGISQAEYLYLRRGNFRRLDRDGDGRLSFEEYAVDGILKFAQADNDGSGRLSPREFATTAIRRKVSTDCDAPATREPERAGRQPAGSSPDTGAEDA